MINGKSVLAIIPARGGSRRLPGKNLRPLCGKPMIHWTIEAAQQSRYIDTLVVSTEDEAIKQAVADRGVQLHERPMELAGDKSSVYDTIFHALDQFPPHDYVVLLQATSPLRVPSDIDNAIDICRNENAPSCISVEQGRPDANGAVYVAWTPWLREHRIFDGGRTVVYVMPPDRSVDVDRLEDFEKAERILSKKLTQAAHTGKPWGLDWDG